MAGKIKGYFLMIPANTFRVEDGKIRYNTMDMISLMSVMAIYFVQTGYSYYVIATEYRFVGRPGWEKGPDWAFRNSGIMIHGQSCLCLCSKTRTFLFRSKCNY